MRLLAIAAVLPWCSARQAPLRTEMDAGPSSGSSGSSPERRAEMAALLDKYAPVFKLA
jgi:hypothetical protein